MKIKAITLLLLASMLLASCSQGSTTSDNAAAADTSASETTSVETTAAETEPEIITDDIPDGLDFGGKSFRTVQQSTGSVIYTESENGEQVNDAIYSRMVNVEERFNVNIEVPIAEAYDKVAQRINNSVLAGEDAYDLSLGQMYQSGYSAVQGIYYNINDLPYVDTDKPWYTKSVKEATIGDKLYMVASDLSLSYTQQTWMIMFNKTKAVDHNIPDMYKLVNDGKWTLDKLYELTKDVYIDKNGDSTRDLEDFYGYAGLTGGCMLAGFYYGCDAKFLTIDNDLKITQHIGEEHSINVLTKLAALIANSEGSYLWKDNNAGGANRKTLFPKGNFLFAPMLVSDLTMQELRNMSDEYGVLPMPKYSESQAEYNTVVDGGADMVAIPATITDPEMIGAVIEALGALGYNEVLPEYINMALEVKGVRDEESVQILRDILASRVVDFAYMYDGNRGWTMKIRDMIRNVDQIKSLIDSNMNAVNTYYTEALATLTAK